MTRTLHAIYDGDCAFCTRSLNILGLADVQHRIERHDARRRDLVLARFPQLAGADLDDAMFVVDPDGRVYRGYFAFKRLLRGLPLAWPLLLCFFIPGADVVGPRVYAWVARNRRRFGCASDACELPPSTGPQSH